MVDGEYIITKEIIDTITCPNCGNSDTKRSRFCQRCNVGLMRIVGQSKQFSVPNDAYEIHYEPDQKLEDVLKMAAGSLLEGGCAYVLWNNVPVIIGMGIEIKDAMENYRQAQKEVSRKNLGQKWKTSFDAFQSLLADMQNMPVNQRVFALQNYIVGGDPNLNQGDYKQLFNDFFRRPSFDVFEKIEMYSPANKDEAENLDNFVSALRGYIPRSGVNK